MSKISVRNVPAPLVLFPLMALIAILGVYFAEDIASPFVAKANVILTEKLKNQTLEIQTVGNFVTELAYLRARFLMKFGIIEEDLRKNLCKDLNTRLARAEGVFVNGGKGSEYGMKYSVKGSANLEATKYIVGGKINRRNTVYAMTEEDKGDVEMYTNILALDAGHYTYICEEYDQRALNFLVNSDFELTFFQKVLEPMICINILTANWDWDVCPLRPFSKGQDWARQLYEKGEKNSRETQGDYLESHCRNTLHRTFGGKWIEIDAIMTSREYHRKSPLDRKPCSILDDASQSV